MEPIIMTKEEAEALVKANLYYVTRRGDIMAPNLCYCRNDAPVFALRDDKWVQVDGKAKATD